MSISNTTETNILKLIYQAIAWAGYADNTATTPETVIHNALHVVDPGDTGNLGTSETTYTGYTRVAVSRNTAGWTESTGAILPVANIDFAAGTGGGGSIGFWSTGKTGAVTATILWSGTVSPSISAGSGVTPRLTTASTISLD